MTVVVNDLMGSISDDISICPGSSANLIASGGVGYAWSPSAGLDNPTSPTPIASPLATTEYCVTITAATNGCADVLCTTVTLASNLIANAGTDVSICQNENTILTASGGTFYQWSPSTGLSNVNVPNPVATPTTTTTYCVTVSDASGCTARDCITVDVSPTINANAGLDQTICNGEQIILAGSGGTNYQWSPVNGLTNAAINNPVASPTSTTTYCVTVSDAVGCTAVDCINIIVTPSPSTTAGNDQTICAGETTQLFAMGGSQYQWSPSTNLSSTTISNPIATPISTTTYCVTVTDAQGCTDTDCIQINVNESINANAGSDVQICTGSETTLFATGGRTYVWSPSIGLSNPTIAAPVATPNFSTTYCVTVTDANGCTDVDCVLVEVEDDLAVSAGSDQIVCAGTQAQLNATGGVFYQWSPTTGLSNPTIPNPTVLNDFSTTYCVTVTTNDGCMASDCMVLSISQLTGSAGADQTICQGASAQLSAIGGTSYQWSPSTGLSNPNIATPIATPAVSTTYCVYQ